MSDRRIRITYDVVSWPGEDGDPEVESGFEDEAGLSMEPDAFDVEAEITAVDKAVAFLRGEDVAATSGYPWQAGDWYQTEHDQDFRTGEARTRSFHLSGFSPDEERAIFWGVFPRRAAQEAERWDQYRKQRHRRLAPARPHGLCEYAGRCVEHAANRRVPSCKEPARPSRCGKGRRPP